MSVEVTTVGASRVAEMLALGRCSPTSAASRLMYMATCAAGTERAVVHEIMQKVQGTVFGPFLPRVLSDQERAEMVACRRQLKPHALDFPVAETLLHPEEALARLEKQSHAREPTVAGTPEGALTPTALTSEKRDSAALSTATKEQASPHPKPANGDSKDGKSSHAAQGAGSACKQRAYEIADCLIQEGVVIFATETAAHQVIHSLQCVKAVYAFVGARDIPTAAVGDDLRTHIGALAATGDFAFQPALQCWMDLYGPGGATKRGNSDARRATHNQQQGNEQEAERKRSKLHDCDASEEKGATPQPQPPQPQQRMAPRFMGNLPLSEGAEAVLRSTWGLPPVHEPLKLDSVGGILEHGPKFRASIEKRTSKSYGVQTPLLAGSLGAGVQLRFHWPVDLTRFSIEVFTLLTDVPRAGFVGIALTDARNVNARHRQEFGLAAMQTYIAAALVRLADPRPGQVVLDNMCGIGTIPIEGAHMYRNTLFLGSDTSCDAIDISKRNVGALEDTDAASRVIVFAADGADTPLAPHAVDIVISDLPWGRRCGSAKGNRKLYPLIFQEWLRVLRPGGVAWALTLEKKLVHRMLQQEPFASSFTLAESTIIDIAHKVTLFKLIKKKL